MVDKEAYAIAATFFLRLSHLLWDGGYIFCDHRKLAYIFSPEACAVSIALKATAQRLQLWSAFFGQFKHTIVHIPAGRTC